VTFDVVARDLPQTATATISAAYAGVTKSSSFTVTPAAISSFGCVVSSYQPGENTYAPSQCSVVGGDFSTSGSHEYVGFAVHITAPAPHSGYKIPLTFTLSAPPGQEPPPTPFDIGISKTLEVPPGGKYAFYPFHTPPVASTGVIKVTATDPITHNSYPVELTVVPPGIRLVQLPATIDGVPLGGKEFGVEVWYMSDPPSHGIAYDVTYGGTTDIKGPARVRIDPPDSSRRGYFTVKILPCAVNPPCHVSVTLGGKTATAAVNP
jgi:hypothetical protein